MRIRAYGRASLLVELETLDDVLGLHADLHRAPPAGLVDAVAAARTLLVTIDTRASSLAAVAADVRARGRVTLPAPAGAEATVPVTYDGVDLVGVARATGWSTAEVVRRHRSAAYVVALIGFAPGFYFLAGGDPHLRVPRLSSPRASVPRGAVAIAGEFTGVYPRTGPGGWQVIGHTTAALWDPDRIPSALLTPGTRVRLVEAAR